MKHIYNIATQQGQGGSGVAGAAVTDSTPKPSQAV